MANNLNMKYTTGENLLSLLSQVTTSLNNKINNIPNVEINNNGNFEIKGVDTNVKAKGQDGKTLTGIECDKSNNIIITSSDGTTSKVGNLNTTVSGGIASEDGLGEVRYYNGKFQYKNNNTWIDIVSTSDNKIYSLLVPKAMKKVSVKQDSTSGKPSLILIPPSDTMVDGQTICFVEKVVVRRKKDSIPTDINDGEEVLVLTREHFKDYQDEEYIDSTFNGNEGDIWYYRAFPVSTLGLVNMEDNYMRTVVGGYIYGFHIDQNESDPSSMITYIEQNRYYDSAYMDYALDFFNYGDWKDAWFIKDLKPCMLNYDGTVAYELDKNDYSKKKDGTPSDITDTSFNGNAMMGIPKVYYKIVDNGDNTADVYISNKKVDNDYHCWSHLDNEGNEIDYCYMAIYESSKDSNGVLRSLSGKSLYSGKGTNYKGTDFLVYLDKNNVTSDKIWSFETFSDRNLISLLLLLIGRSTDSQTVFGTGKISGNSSSFATPGTMNSNGLFYGGDNIQVKTFGIEGLWGNMYERVCGFICDKGTYKIKLTYGQSDGSTVDGYNTDGTGYINTGITPGDIDNTFISKYIFLNSGCILPTEANGSSSTYYCDAIQTNSSLSDGYVSIGGCVLTGRMAGLFQAWTDAPIIGTSKYLGGRLACKPSLATQTSQS